MMYLPIRLSVATGGAGSAGGGIGVVGDGGAEVAGGGTCWIGIRRMVASTAYGSGVGAAGGAADPGACVGAQSGTAGGCGSGGIFGAGPESVISPRDYQRRVRRQSR